MRVLVLMLSLLSFSIFAQSTISNDELHSIAKHNPDFAWQLVKDGAQLVDVRTPQEYQSQKIEQAANISVQEMVARVDELDKSRVVVVYCRSGNRSGSAANFLRAQGYSVYDAGTFTLMSQSK